MTPNSASLSRRLPLYDVAVGLDGAGASAGSDAEPGRRSGPDRRGSSLLGSTRMSRDRSLVVVVDDQADPRRCRLGRSGQRRLQLPGRELARSARSQFVR